MQERSLEFLDNRYQLLEKLGAGGMGAVFRARDRLTRQVVALKRVHLGSLHHHQAASATPTAFSQFAMQVAEMKKSCRYSQDTSQKDCLALAQEFRTLSSLRHPALCWGARKRTLLLLNLSTSSLRPE